MQESIHDVRRAAILIASLDRETADTLLSQLPSTTAEQVRRAAASLDDLDPMEQKDVIGEFLQTKTPSKEREPATEAKTSPLKDTGGVELSDSLLARFADTSGDTKVDTENADPLSNSPAAPFLGIEASVLAEILKEEHPQTIACVVSQLSPPIASMVLDQLPKTFQDEILPRVVDLAEVNSTVVDEIVDEIRRRADELQSRSLSRAKGIAFVADVLSNQQRPMPELDGMETPERPFSNKSASVVNLEDMDDATLQVVAESVSDELLVLALTGSDEEFCRRYLRLLAADRARFVRSKMANLLPTRLRELELAKDELASRAAKLVKN